MVVRMMGIIMSETTTSSKVEERRAGSFIICGEREGTIRQRIIRRVRRCGNRAKLTHLNVQHLPARALEGVNQQAWLGGGVVDAVNEVDRGDDREPPVEGGHTKGKNVDHVLRRAEGDPRRLHALERVEDEPCIVHLKPAHFGRRCVEVREAVQGRK
jgi:hypothetical protein